jgi:uncharacterized protein
MRFVADVRSTLGAQLGEHIEAVPLIDRHVHGCWTQPVDRSRFENGLNEANVEPLPDFDSAFDTQIGFAVRAHWSPLLGLDRHADADRYWGQRNSRVETDTPGCSCPRPT